MKTIHDQYPNSQNPEDEYVSDEDIEAAKEAALLHERMRKAKLIEMAIKDYLRPDLSLFADSPEHQNHIIQDNSYVNFEEARISKQEETDFRSIALEYMIQYSIQNGDFLNNQFNRESAEGGKNYYAESIWPTRFDDIKNRVDAAAFLHSSGDREEENHEHIFPVAFDITHSKHLGVIREKILISSNNPSLGYYTGFTDIRYCRDSKGELSWQRRVPRFCIGVDETAIDDILDRMQYPDSSRGPSFDDESVAITQFKIAYEMLIQSKLFLSSLNASLNLQYGATKEPNYVSKARRRQRESAEQLHTIIRICKEELEQSMEQLPQELLHYSNASSEQRSIGQIASQLRQQDGTFSAIIRAVNGIRSDYSSYPDDGNKSSTLFKLSLEALETRAMNQLIDNIKNADAENVDAESISIEDIDPKRLKRHNESFNRTKSILTQNYYRNNPLCDPKMRASLVFPQTPPPGV